MCCNLLLGNNPCNFCSRVLDIASSCLPSSRPTCLCDLPTCLNNLCHQKGDMLQENTIFERGANYDPLLSVGEDQYSFLGGSLLGDDDLCSSNNVHYTWPYHFQVMF